MCSELFRIPYEVAGVPIFGFGVLLAIWALATLATVVGLIKRNGRSGETLSAIPMLLLVGAAIVALPKVFPDGFPVRGYGVLLLAGISAGVGMAIYRARQAGLDHEVILALAIWLVICGVVGARLFYVVEYWNQEFANRSPRDTLLKILNVPAGGLVIYGGFIGAAAGFVAFMRKHKLPLLAMADLVAPSFMIGLALGRIGCFLNGCCYGGQTDWPWAVTFPSESPPYADQAARGELYGFRLERDKGQTVVKRVEPVSAADEAGLKVGDEVVAIDGQPIESVADPKNLIFDAFRAQRKLQIKLRSGDTIEVGPAQPPPRSRPVHPAQLYSALDAGLLAWLLWSYYPFRRRDGAVLALMLTIHPITRFLLEYIRTDEPAVFGTGLSISQNISIVLFLCAGVLWWYLSRQRAGVMWPLVPATVPNQDRRPVRSNSGKSNKPSTARLPESPHATGPTTGPSETRPRRPK